jgi:amino acid permease
MGTLIWSVMALLQEMTALFPSKGLVPQLPKSLYTDGIDGFAKRWMTWWDRLRLRPLVIFQLRLRQILGPQRE